MKIKQTGNAFAFTFETLADIELYNAWIDELGIVGAHVLLPMGMSPRNARRVLTKSPAILKADDDHAIDVIKDRWM